MAIVAKLKYPVKAKTSSDMDKLLKIFKNKMKDSQILKEYFERSYFVKPSEKKRHKKLIGQYRAKQDNKKYQ